MNEVEICTGSVKCFCRKKHKAAAITGKNWSKLLFYEDKVFCCLTVAKKCTFPAFKKGEISIF
jgi:hypothetical protein